MKPQYECPKCQLKSVVQTGVSPVNPNEIFFQCKKCRVQFKIVIDYGHAS